MSHLPDFPPTRNRRREREPTPARTLGCFRGTESFESDSLQRRTRLPPWFSSRRSSLSAYLSFGGFTRIKDGLTKFLAICDVPHTRPRHR
jgi:hypothetical protein